MSQSKITAIQFPKLDILLLQLPEIKDDLASGKWQLRDGVPLITIQTPNPIQVEIHNLITPQPVP